MRPYIIVLILIHFANLTNICLSNNVNGNEHIHPQIVATLVVFNSSTDSGNGRPLYLVLRNSETEKLSSVSSIRKRIFRLQYLKSRIRGGYSKQTVISDNSEAEDKYHDLRSLFSNNRDGNEEQSVSSIEEIPSLTVSTTPAVLMSSNSLATVLIGMWSAIPAIVRFVGGYIIMESARHFWNDYRQRQRLKQSSPNGSRFSSSALDRTVLDPNLAYLNGLGSDELLETENDKSSKRDPTRKTSTSSSFASSFSSDALEKLQAEQAELWGAISKLHGMQTESLSSVEKVAEDRWSSVAAQLQQMLESVQQLTQRTDQKLSESSQQMEALSLDLDGMHAENKEKFDKERKRFQQLEERLLDLTEREDELSIQLRRQSASITDAIGANKRELAAQEEKIMLLVADRLRVFKEDVKKILQGLKKK